MPDRGILTTTGARGDAATVGRGQFSRDLAIVLALAVLTMSLYGATARFGFCGYDDPDYITENAVVRRGFTAPASSGRSPPRTPPTGIR
jgi:hypothetical protein